MRLKLKWILASASFALLVAGVFVVAFPPSSFPVEWSHQCPPNERVWRLEYTADGSTLIGLCEVAGTQRLCAWNASDGTVSSLVTSVNEPRTFAVDPKGRWIAVSGSEGIVFWDLKTNRELERYERGGPAAEIKVSEDGEYMAITVEMGTSTDSGRPRNLILFKLADDTVVDMMEISKPEMRVALSADGSKVAMSSASETLSLLDPRTRSTRNTTLGTNRRGRVIEFLKGDAGVLVDDGQLRVWNLADDSFAHPFDPTAFERMRTEQVAIDRNRSVVAAGGLKVVELTNRYYGQAVVFRIGESTPLGFVREGDRIGLTPREAIMSVALSPDGNHLATASSTGRVRSWAIKR